MWWKENKKKIRNEAKMRNNIVKDKIDLRRLNKV